VTQDAVLPASASRTVFAQTRVGTFWYHVSSQVVVEGSAARPLRRPRDRTRDTPPAGLDLVAVAHTFDGIPTLERGRVGGYREKVPAARVSNPPREHRQRAALGSPSRNAVPCLAIDGTELNEPAPLANVGLPLAAAVRDGHRICPAGVTQSASAMEGGIVNRAQPVERSGDRRVASEEGLRPAVLRPAGTDTVHCVEHLRSPFLTRHHKEGRLLRRSPGRQWAINGGIYPDVPMFVRRGGRPRQITISNESGFVIRCTCTATTPRPQPRWTSLQPEPMVGGQP